MSDVTCRLIKEQLGFLEMHGVSTAALRKKLEERWGPPEGKMKWLASLSRLPWNEFAFYCREVEPYFTPNLVRRFVDKTIEGPSDWVDVVRPLFRFAVTPAQVYSMVNTWMGPWAFRNVRRTSERRDGSMLHVRLELRPEDQDCALFFHFTHAMFEQLPRVVGSIRAHVAMTTTGRSADYSITLPPRLSLWGMVRRRFLALFASNTLFRELAAREQELHGNATRLRETQLVLEEAVRERTAELESTNRQLSERVATVQRLEKIAHLGTWTWHLREPRHLVLSDETYRLFAIDPRLKPTPELLRTRIHPDDLPLVKAANNKSRLLGLPMECDHRIILPDGTVRWIAERGEVIKDEAGKPLRVIGSALDVTLQKRYEQSLIAAKEAADAANRTKSTFLANVSHEIRTPMSSVLGFAELLTTPNLPAEKHQAYVDKILRNGRHLLALIDDVLDRRRSKPAT